MPFILGITNHWIGAIAYKSGKLCPCKDNHPHLGEMHNKFDMIILDSNNNANITASDEDIICKVEQSEKEKMAKSGKGFGEWRKSMYQQSHKDQRDILLKIASCIAGKLDLRQEKAENYAKEMLKSYATNVDTPLQSSTPDLYLPLLLSWMDDHYPPQVLKEGITQLVSASTISCLSVCTYRELAVWATDNYTRLMGVSLNSLPGVRIFADTVDYVKTELQLSQLQSFDDTREC